MNIYRKEQIHVIEVPLNSLENLNSQSLQKSSELWAASPGVGQQMESTSITSSEALDISEAQKGLTEHRPQEIPLHQAV